MPGTVWQKQGILREIKEDIALKKPIVEQGQEVCNRNLHKAQGKCTRMRGACGTLETQREHIWSGAWKQPSYGGGGTADGGLGVKKAQGRRHFSAGINMGKNKGVKVIAGALQPS